MDILVAVVAIFILLIGVILALSLVVWLIYKRVRGSDPNEINKPAKQEPKQPDPPKEKAKTTEQKPTSKEGAPSGLIRLMWVGLFLAAMATIASLLVVFKPQTEGMRPPAFQPVTTSNPVVYSSKTNLPLPPSCIADRESGDGTPGSARQFMKDGVTPVLNPLNLLAVGTWQINLADPAVLALVKKEKLDVEYSKEDNDAAASLLYAEKPGGNLDPWKATSSCVGSNTIELALEAPTNRFGEGKRMIPGRPTDIYGNGKRYTLRFNRTVEEDWPLPSGATSRAPAEVTFLEAKSRENHLISIKVVMR